MKNSERWQPSKYVLTKKGLRASRDLSEVAISSRLIDDLVAVCYERYLPQFCQGRLLDLGCGKAPLYGFYRKYITEAVCVDWPGSYHSSDYVDFSCDLTKPLPFAAEEFDTILLSDVLEHLSDSRLLWKEMNRILKRQGKLFLSTPFCYGLHEEPHDYFRYTEYALLSYAQSHGFQVLVLESLGGIPEISAVLLAKELEKRGFLCRAFAAAVQQTAFWLNRHHFMKHTRRRFPLEYFLVAEKYCQPKDEIRE